MLPQGLGFKNEFDKVFSNATLHWLSADPQAVVRGTFEALRPGGQLVAEFEKTTEVNITTAFWYFVSSFVTFFKQVQDHLSQDLYTFKSK